MRYVLFYCGAETELYGGWTEGKTWNGWDVIYTDARTTRKLLLDGKTDFQECQTSYGPEFYLEDSEFSLMPDRLGPDGTGLYCLAGFCCQIQGED